MKLVSKKYYQAEIHLGGFDQFATNTMVAGELAKYGFAHVEVSGTGKVRTAKGQYVGEPVDVSKILQQDKRIKNVKAL